IFLPFTKTHPRAGSQNTSDIAPRQSLPPTWARISFPILHPLWLQSRRMEPLGLIAGEGVFPLLVARGARAAGRKVICAAFSKNAWPDLEREVDHFQWVGILRIGSWINVLKQAAVSEAIMVGRVAKSQMYDRWRYFRYIPDLRTAKLWFRTLRHDKRPQAVLQALVNELSSEGIRLIDSTTYCSEHLATPGVMTRRQPTDSQWRDIHNGWAI